jgi:ADP-ribose pyrophosphatase YjhB (NUDIX family)
MGKKSSHCSYCGQAFAEGQPWPRTCGACQVVSFENPLPVAVVVVPVGNGVLTVRRAIPPHVGELALPGGFIGVGESWQQAGAREVLEETGVVLDPDRIRDLRVLSAPDGTVLVFGLAEPLERPPILVANAEVSELVIVDRPVTLAFPLHTRVLAEFFSRMA